MGRLKEWMEAHGEKFGFGFAALLFLAVLGWSMGMKSEAQQMVHTVGQKLNQIRQVRDSGEKTPLDPLKNYRSEFQAALKARSVQIPGDMNIYIDPPAFGTSAVQVQEEETKTIDVTLPSPSVRIGAVLVKDEATGKGSTLVAVVDKKDTYIVIRAGKLPVNAGPQKIKLQVNGHNNVLIQEIHLEVNRRPDTLALLAPASNLRATLPGDLELDRVELRWDPAKASHQAIKVEYQLERAQGDPDPNVKAPPAQFSKIYGPGPHTAYTDSGVEPGFRYWYRVVTVVQTPGVEMTAEAKKPTAPSDALVPGPFLFRISSRTADEAWVDLYEWKGGKWSKSVMSCSPDASGNEGAARGVRSKIGATGIVFFYFDDKDPNGLKIIVCGDSPATKSQVQTLQLDKVYRLRRGRFERSSDIEEYAGELPKAEGEVVELPAVNGALLKDVDGRIEAVRGSARDPAKKKENLAELDKIVQDLAPIAPGKAPPSEISRANKDRAQVESLKAEVNTVGDKPAPKSDKGKSDKKKPEKRESGGGKKGGFRD